MRLHSLLPLRPPLNAAAKLARRLCVGISCAAAGAATSARCARLSADDDRRVDWNDDRLLDGVPRAGESGTIYTNVYSLALDGSPHCTTQQHQHALSRGPATLVLLWREVMKQGGRPMGHSSERWLGGLYANGLPPGTPACTPVKVPIGSGFDFALVPLPLEENGPLIYKEDKSCSPYFSVEDKPAGRTQLQLKAEVSVTGGQEVALLAGTPGAHDPTVRESLMMDTAAYYCGEIFNGVDVFTSSPDTVRDWPGAEAHLSGEFRSIEWSTGILASDGLRRGPIGSQWRAGLGPADASPPEAERHISSGGWEGLCLRPKAEEDKDGNLRKPPRVLITEEVADRMALVASLPIGSLAGWYIGDQPSHGANTGYDTKLIMQVILPSTVELVRLAQAEEAAWQEANPGGDAGGEHALPMAFVEPIDEDMPPPPMNPMLPHDDDGSMLPPDDGGSSVLVDGAEAARRALTRAAISAALAPDGEYGRAAVAEAMAAAAGEDDERVPERQRRDAALAGVAVWAGGELQHEAAFAAGTVAMVSGAALLVGGGGALVPVVFVVVCSVYSVIVARVIAQLEG
ncbi:hypothetical protein EMIHUDRAFT_437590 [Emiliania huxleyi CCMP1516]|uniref:Uncharacterized protein n=2 Tax=Emiliania huxleyi TaxID=2903 RepID=A0A0D3IK71_EMIH1|nr:hypothetical protein EMIHUDRAFT_437590 [Emiliania huxleyi CCMP1516]EOD11656.1 hypothetical protein EMIHUDRAFT_437590 [Emiliania huxleyi CCMP1516]|eukprot:XP_005764085.1 hypothetical protein EMIHUDRAFT_437590 [Emiliania huxleyi CCMP1516]